MKATDMILNRFKPLATLIVLCFCITPLRGYSQVGDKLPVREYTNPEEVVTFDRSISFSRALDVINEFSRKYRQKMIIDRTQTEGSIGISIPSMHWMDALKTILQVKRLQLVEGKDFYEIVRPRSSSNQVSDGRNGTGGGQQSVDGPKATLDTREVRINAIFFEGNRRALKEIGVDWSTLTNNTPDNIGSFANGQQGGGGQGGGGQGGGGQGGGQSQGQLPSQGFDGPFVSVNSKGAQNVSQNVFNSIINFGEIGDSGIRVQALFSAFEADNLGEILASPTVKVVDGEEGRIQVGQDFSIKQRDFAGNVVEEFFSVGTILTVTPEVITQNDTTFIHLDINAERSSAQPDPVSTIINKQQAETQALLMDGEATILAGLYRTEKTEVRRGIPILKDLPPWFFGLRYLFGYNSQDYQMRELVVLVQASLAPSVPERFGDDHRNKFDVLQDERRRMRKEIKKSEKVLQEKDLEEEPEEENTDNAMRKQLPKARPEVKKEDKKPRSQKVNNQSEAKKAAKENKRDKISADPEVQSKEIALDLEDTQDEASSSRTVVDSSVNRSEEGEAESTNNNVVTHRGQSSADARYHIIGGSFSVEANAIQLKKQLQNSGYQSAMIIPKPNSSMWMVSYGGYDRYSKASADLRSIQSRDNEGAWLYTNK